MTTINSIIQSGYGHFKVSITFRGKDHSATTTNTLAIDRYRSDDLTARQVQHGYTFNQAKAALINIVKSSCNLK